jgi:TolB protein
MRRIAPTLVVSLVILGVTAYFLFRGDDATHPSGDGPADETTTSITFVRAGPGETILPGDVVVHTNPEIYVLSPDEELTNVSDNRALDAAPAFSPDGTMIAFSRAPVSAPSRYRIYTMSSDGTRVRRITRCESAECPAELGLSWAPDGTKLAFVGAGEGLFTVDSSGGIARRVVPDGRIQPFGGVSWSPDGSRLIFDAVASSGRVDLFGVQAEGGPVTRLSTCRRPACEGGNSSPALSPDGRSIAFIRGFGGIGAVYVMGADGDGVRELVPCGRACDGYSSPAWAPDSASIVVSYAKDTRGDLVIVDAENGELRKLTTGDDVDCCPSWSGT